jgi:hypothetical protein
MAIERAISMNFSRGRFVGTTVVASDMHKLLMSQRYYFVWKPFVTVKKRNQTAFVDNK